nr:uncharacterized protein LOC127304225 [Lolium perenne]
MSTPSSNPFADSSNPEPGQLRAIAITDHVPVKLSTTAANYLAWKTYFYLLFREYNLRDHIDGTADLLACDADWLAIDATIIRWLFLTVSPDIFKIVVREGDDARTVWGKINGLFTNNKLQRVVFLQQEFFGTPQGDQTLDAYCLRLKAISDEIQDLGFRIGDELLLSTLTAGLNEDLGNAASNLTLMTNPTFERAVDYLRLEERRLKVFSLMAEELHRRPPPPLHNLRLSCNNTKEEGAVAAAVAVAVVVAVAVATMAAPSSSVRAPGTHTPLRRGRADTTPGRGSCTPTPCPSRAPPPPSPAPSAPRPPTHKAFIAAPPQAPAGLPYAPAGLPYGGLMPPAPTAHWDPALYTAFSTPPRRALTLAVATGSWTPEPPHTWLLTRFGRPILALQTDNGKEFDNTTIRTLLSIHGTIFRLTCPYTSQQNGRAERVLRTLNDCVRTLLFHAHMPPPSSGRTPSPPPPS